jgi:hypothetical protein
MPDPASKSLRTTLDTPASALGRDFWLVLLAALLLHIAAFGGGVSLYDEGIILVGAESVFSGKLPYRDFWTMYGPGEFYLGSWLFSLFGVSVLPLRATGLLAKALIVALAFVAMRRTAGRAPAFIGAAVIAGFLVRQGQETFPVFPATALALGAILLLDTGRRGQSWQLLAAGVLTALAACFRHDLGAYVAAGAVISLVVDGWLRGAGAAVAQHVGRYVLGILAVALPVGGFFLIKIPLSDLYENLIYIPSKIYPGVRALPWPDPEILTAIFERPQAVATLAVYVPFFVCTAALLIEAVRVAKHCKAGVAARTSGECGSFLVLVLALTSLLFTLKGAIRVSNLHMAPALVLAMALLPATLIGALRQRWHGMVLAIVVLLPAIALVALAGWPGFVAAWNGGDRLRHAEHALMVRCRKPQLPRMRCLGTDADYLAAARYVAEHSRAADTIYVGTGRHDKLFVNAVAFYFLAERRPATKWYELHPGVQTQLRVQGAMIDEMTVSPPSLVLLDSRWDDLQEPNLSRIDSGATALDEFIGARYIEVARFGSIRVLAPR